MNKPYTPPFLELDRFDVEDILTSSGIGEGDGAFDTLDSDEPIDII